ncbi:MULTISPECIES: thiol-disulfide oxidoreductase DCC family protein [Ornithinibacillus]|uniref:Thiol-disulfide oxidoreductase DCC family protein n=2 Tax=Ornithinibacillus TaxID=484508 RepID=A0A923L5G9_9BACI|nr:MULTISPECIES: thiol-disulfide oxidoreductase DCC family protein [Ornithinibacillus]MBC5636855.1 thiol-disulfide oxidoreductase DCC family protein [Ornithinibacillus hominis]MBS3681421.1 thiol-disulfide oxidoreductase DCC family protein [Ornithinibacillus massiliensis]
MRRIILFDGVCNFCNSSVQFIIKRDTKGRYKFTSLQSPIGQQLLKENEIPDELDSFIYLEGNTVYYKSTAALKVCKGLKGPWKFMYAFIVVPRPIRDLVYGVIAKNRYKWFGKREKCMIPTPEQRERFLDA